MWYLKLFALCFLIIGFLLLLTPGLEIKAKERGLTTFRLWFTGTMFLTMFFVATIALVRSLFNS